MNKSADCIKPSENSDEMSPKNGYDPATGSNANGNVEEVYLQEMLAVNESLDELSTALDCFEQRTDNIIEQLKELLHSNREMRAELAMEKAAATPSECGKEPSTDTDYNAQV